MTLNIVSNSDTTSSSIASICKIAQSYAKRISDFVRAPAFQTAFASINRELGIDPKREYIISFGKDSMGSISLSEVSHGNKSNAPIPAVANAFADVHNHPRNTPPSSGDLYGLIRKNKRERQYNTRLVVTASKIIYALIVIDTSAADSFLMKYPPQQVKGYSPLFLDELLNEYREIQQRYGVKEENAMAFMLHQYKTGVVLLKGHLSGEFVIHTKSFGSGDERRFVHQNCEGESD